jgi:N-glycosylase/DNA lyase
MITHKTIREEHKKKKSIIRKRLNEFKHGGKNSDEKERFIELCFCLCTPQSNAKRVAKVINNENIDKLMHCEWNELAELLRTNTRFHNNKAKYIIDARRFIPDINKLPNDALIAREFLVRNIKGLGYKEASHFLRNLGYRDLCIIDRHIIDLMHQLRVFKTKKFPTSTKQYLTLEKQIKDYAKRINIDVDELDLLLWSMKTGFVFK